MTGIFNLKFESREQGNDFEYLFMHLENANRLKDTLVKYILPEQELNLIDYRLNNIPFTPSGFRFENFASRQDNMIYRTEGIIGDIWEKIKAFFKWILDKIKSLFGLNKESPSAPPTQEFEKVEKEASKKVEELKPIINEDLDEKLNNANKLADLIESGGTSDELDELMDRTASELSKVTGISVEKFRMARKGSEKPTKKEPTEESKKMFEALKVYLSAMLEFGVGFNAFYANLVHFLSRVNVSLGRVTSDISKKDIEQMLDDSDVPTIII